MSAMLQVEQTRTPAAVAAHSRQRDVAYIAAVVLAILGISVLHYLTPPSKPEWHYVYQRLFYLPVIFAAVYYGWRAGLIAAVFAGVFYSPQILAIWGDIPDYSSGQYAEVIIFCLTAILTGIVADKQRAQRLVLEKRTQELSEVYRALRENFEQLKRSERLNAIGQLSAGLAHEIRNPLNSIEGAAAILQKEPTEERRNEFLEIIRKECRRLGALLTDFLNFARPRSPEYAVVNVGQLFQSVVGLATHAVGRASVVIRTDLPLEEPTVECDPDQLKQVILNLTINAVQAMPDGGEIVLAARQENGNVKIQVQDQGCGVSPGDLEKLYDPFFTTKATGTGLGLPVAYQIVAQHGGVLTAENNADRGMTFLVVLPMRRRRPQ